MSTIALDFFLAKFVSLGLPYVDADELTGLNGLWITTSIHAYKPKFQTYRLRISKLIGTNDIYILILHNHPMNARLALG